MLAPPPPPASLPPPKRRLVGRRFTRILGVIFVAAGVVAAASVSYTLYQRSESEKMRKLLTQAAPSGADAHKVLEGAPSGYIPAQFSRAEAAPKVEREKEPIKVAVKEEPKPAPPPPPDDNGLEEGRKDAWKRYWTERAGVRKEHFDRRKEAYSDLKTAVDAGGHGGAQSAQAAAPAAAAPASGARGATNPASWWGGGGSSGGFGGGPGGFGGGFPGLGGFGQTAQIDRQGQEQKLDFAGQQGDLGKNDVVPTVRKPADPYAVMAGSFVKFTTINEVNSDVPGSTIGMVTESVYNTSDGTCVLIPQGSKLIGHYDSVVSTGQSRLPGVLTRIIYPDGSSQAIGAMEMADNAGSAGMDDLLNRHLVQKFSGALLAGAFGAGIYLAVPHNNSFNNGYDAQQIIGASLAQQIGQTGQQITQQMLSIPNTVTIRQGYNGTMITDKDIHIDPPWECSGRRRSTLPIMSVSQ